jgi:small subunit ribosomal protein S2
MPTIGLEQLLAAGVHFGHQTHRWNPKMKRYVFGERNGIHIINLKRTQDCLARALDTLSGIVAGGKSVLFVGTKRQAREIIREEAKRCGMYFVTERWLGGMLTNFRTIRASIERLEELERGFESKEYDARTKKEQTGLRKERERLHRTFEGIKGMDRLPGALFVVDTRKERIAVSEADRLAIPVIGIVDTNADPDAVAFPIPGNDDAIRSIQIFARAVGDIALAMGRRQAVEPGVPEGETAEVASHAAPRTTAIPQ